MMEINRMIDASNVSLKKIYEKYRTQLGDTKYSELIDELQAVYVDNFQKEEALPKRPGVLDANSQEIRAMSKKRDIKVILIKQKYGI